MYRGIGIPHAPARDSNWAAGLKYVEVNRYMYYTILDVSCLLSVAEISRLVLSFSTVLLRTI